MSVCRQFWNSVCRLSSICVLAPAYTSLCRGLKHLLKSNIEYDPNETDFFISNNTVFCHGMETLPYVWKIYLKNERHLFFGSIYLHQIFRYDKMSDVTASYGTLFDFIAFLGIFIHYQRPFMSEVSYLYQIFTDYVSNQYTYFDMLTW